MTRFYRIALLWGCLLFIGFNSYGQIPLAIADTPAATPEDESTTFNVTDNDVDLLSGINTSTVDLDLTTGGIQNTYTDGDGHNWSVDSDGNVTYTPPLNFNGTATTLYTVQNNLIIPLTSLPALITVEVTAVNDAPTVSTIADQSTAENTPTTPNPFTVDDVDNPPAGLTLTGSSNNTTLVQNSNITFGGSGTDRTVTVTPEPGQSGTAVIEVQVADGTANVVRSFTVTVTADNELPIISSIADQSTPENTATGAIPFTVGDAETPADDLTLSGTSSNTTLVQNGSIIFGGSGINRTVTITPEAGQVGTTTIQVTVNDGTANASTSFTLTVTNVNEAPTISAIGNQSTPENTATGAIAFTVADTDNPVGSLTVSGTSSNTALVQNASIVFGGSGANRTVTLTPEPDQSGTTTIEITVSDGTATASTSFTLTVVNANEPPTISAIANQSTPENTATGAIAFTVGDPDNPVGSLTVSGTSSNTALVQNVSIVFGGSGANRTVTLTPQPNQSGTTTIEVTVSDGALTASTSFTLTVTAVNDPPTISAISNQSTSENTPTGAIAFTIDDPDNGVGTLIVTGVSSNTTLVTNDNISFGGGGANRTVTITPQPGQSGTTTITITVSDGTANATSAFVLSVNDVNDPPTISVIANQTTSENTATDPIPFTINDNETPAASLTVSASSSNPALVPVANITFGGSGANRTVTINPGSSQSGTATITITVSDGTATASRSFDLTIDPINDSPTVTPISNQTVAENTPTSPIPFSIGDAETPASNLTVTATSSVTTLVSNGNIQLGGTGSDRTITITPTAGQSGSTLITISVSDGTAVTSISFTLTVNSVNDAPTITSIGNQTTNEDVATAALPFTVGDPDTPAASLTVTASSNNQTLVPNANIALFGDDISRTVTVTPAPNQTGTATITLTVSDGTATATTSFQVTVVAVNDAPTISAISNQTTNENTATPALAFTVADPETAVASLTVTGTSSNLTLVPNANVVIGGSGGNRTVTVTPAPGQSGSTTITLSVSDGTATTSTSFQLTVTSINDAPTISAIPAQTTNEDVATAAISFTIGDSDSPIGSLTVTGSSSNKTLVPEANLNISTTGATRTVVITPALNQFGTTTITLTVTDGGASAQTTFTLTVSPVNDAPTITGQVPLITPEDTPFALLPEHFTISDPDDSEDGYSVIIVQTGNYFINENSVTPPKDFYGDLEVTVKIADGKLQSPEFIAIINVTDVNIPPVITGQNPTPIPIPLNQSYELTPQSLTISDEDGDRDFTLTVSPGENYLLSGPNLTTITPALDYLGPLNVTVTVSDGKASSEPFSVKINVFQPGSQPVISGQQPLIINEDETLEVSFDHLSVTDADDSYPNGFTIIISTSNGAYTVNNNQITPPLNFNGILEVPISVSDGNTPSEPFNIRIYVVPVNDAPEITAIESDIILYEPGSGPKPISDIFECEDVDNEFLNFAEIKLVDSSYSERNDELIFENVDGSPLRGIYDASKGVLSLIGLGTPEQYMEAIRSVKYNYRLTTDDNGEPSQISTDPKFLAITLSDGQLFSKEATREINLETSVELNIPNAFTPNGDTENSTWAIRPVTPTDQFNNTIVRVYNKRGLVVFESTGIEKEWDGTFNGELLPVDTYYYTIDLKLSFIKKTYKGAVTILR